MSDTFIPYEVNTEWLVYFANQIGRASRGNNGKSGSKSIGIEPPKPSKISLEPIIIINRIKGYIRERMMVEPSRRENLSFFLKRLDEHKGVKMLYNMSLFLDEMDVLEGQVDRLKCSVDFQPSYTSLIEGINDFQRRKMRSSESLKVLRYMCTALLNRVYNLKYNYESNLIENVTDHLESVKKDLETLRDSLDTSTYLLVLNKYKEQYKLSIQDRMKELDDLVKKFNKQSLEKIIYDLNYKFDSLFAEMIDLYKAKNEKERILEKALLRKELLTSFQLVGHVISLLSVPGVSNVWDMEITSEIKMSEKKIGSILRQKIRRLTYVLDICYESAVIYPDKVGKKIFEIKQNLTKDNLDIHEFRNLEDEFLKNILTNTLALESEDSNELNKNVEISITKFKKIVAFGIRIPDLLFEDDVPKMLRKEYINQTKKWETYESIYEDGIRKMVHDASKIHEYILLRDIVFSNMIRKSDPSICSPTNVKHREVQRFHKETKESLSEVMLVFGAEGDLLSFFEGFQETMTALVEVYDHIQNYQQQQLLASKIEDITYDKINDNKISNPRFIGTVEELQSVIRSNIVLQRYRTAIDAFKQYVFPFASLYLHDLIPLDLNNEYAMAKEVSQINIVQSRIKLYEQTVRNVYNYNAKKWLNFPIHFYSRYFVWKNNDHRSEIRDLLSGNEVLLKADISGSTIGMDAIKFGMIGMEFKTSNRDLQSNFNELLKNFRLRGVHLGNSYYRYETKVYLIPTKSREFVFPFEMEGVTGDMMLSPYASWRFTLVNMTEEADFKELAEYVEEVNLQLVGTGFYVEHNNKDLDVDKYYKPIDYNGNNFC